RWFVFVWLGMWLSTALLPNREVLAAGAAHEQSLHLDCGQPAERTPKTHSEHKNQACLGMAAPSVPADRPTTSVRRNLGQQALAISATSEIYPPRPRASHPLPYRTAPPVAIHLRSTRLLI
ncbi:MAG: hypothetical protein MUP61_00840, partial [Burkholderiales bacterium]|nr:hypothetical protein [Burkholderiales bacterium]